MIELHSQNWKKFLMSDLFYIKGISKRKDDIFDCAETGMYPVLSTKATNRNRVYWVLFLSKTKFFWNGAFGDSST